jgi:hypothetical protein
MRWQAQFSNQKSTLINLEREMKPQMDADEH